MSCKGGICLPEPLCTGWLGSPYTWYLIIITIIAVFLIYMYLNVDHWFLRMITVPLYPGDQGIIWIFSFFYILLLIGVILAAWDMKNPFSKCLLIAYTLVILLTLSWVYAWGLELFGFTLVIIGTLLLIALWLIWLSMIPRGNMLSHILVWFYFIGLLIGVYYNISLYIMNVSV
jgi:hypothetical protein